jgi:predicted PurR-regulated permease PerM
VPGEGVAAGDDEAAARRRAIGRATTITVAIVGVVALVVYAANVLLLVFTGLLLGVALDALASWIASRTRLGRSAALTVVLVALFAALGVGAWKLAPSLVEQVQNLGQRLPEAWSSRLEDLLTGPAAATSPGGGEQAPSPAPVVPAQEAPARGGEPVDPASIVAPVARGLSTTAMLLANALVILVIGIYAAARPEFYVDGVVRLMPHAWRGRAREALRESGRQLRRWMFGTALAMASAAGLTGIGLWLLGVPYALGLALLAGVLELIPNFGPIAAAVPAILLTLADGEVTWWHVALMYLGIQTFQSYVVQPLVQDRVVHVPPVLLIAALALMGWLLGALGLFTAVPLLVVAIVLVKLLWLRDRLGEQVQVS